MEFHRNPWSIHGVPRNSMEFLGVSIEFHGMPCSSMDGSSLEFNGIPWSSLEWSSMECYGVPWSIDEVRYSFPAVCMRIHRNSLIKQLINLLTTCSSPQFLLERKKENILKLFKSISSASVSLNYTDNAKVS